MRTQASRLARRVEGWNCGNPSLDTCSTSAPGICSQGCNTDRQDRSTGGCLTAQGQGKLDQVIIGHLVMHWTLSLAYSSCLILAPLPMIESAATFAAVRGLSVSIVYFIWDADSLTIFLHVIRSHCSVCTSCVIDWGWTGIMAQGASSSCFRVAPTSTRLTSDSADGYHVVIIFTSRCLTIIGVLYHSHA